MEIDVKRDREGRPELLVIEVAGGHGRDGIVADGKPGLRDRPEGEVVGGLAAAHSCGNPARLKGIRMDGGPTPRDREREDAVKELAVGVCLGTVPPTPDPLKVVQARVASPMQARAEVDESVGRRDESSQGVRRSYSQIRIQEVVPRDRIELSTPGFSDLCSTN